MKEQLDRLWTTNENHIIEKMVCFINQLMVYYPDELDTPDMTEIFETNEMYWTTDMHILYAEVRILTKQNELLERIMEPRNPEVPLLTTS